MATESTNTTGNGKTNMTTTKASEPTVSDLQAQLDLMREEVGRLTSMATDVTKAEARRAKRKLEAKGREYREAGEEQYEDLKRSAEGYGEDAVRYVREQPVNALGIAAGLGFVIGFLMSGRR